MSQICKYDHNEPNDQKIIAVCTALNCKHKRPSCLSCLTQLHLEHTQNIQSLNSLQQCWEEKKQTTFSTLKGFQNNCNEFKLVLDNFITSLDIDIPKKELQYLTLSEMDSLAQKLVLLNNIERLGDPIKCLKDLVKNMQVAITSIQNLKTALTLGDFLSTPHQDTANAIQLTKQQQNINIPVIQQKIRFSKQHKTDNIIFQEQEVMAQTTDDKLGFVLCEPGIIQNELIKQFAFQILINDWVAIGICHKDQFLQQKNNFDIWENNKHGCYLIDKSGKVFSQLKSEENNQTKEFKLNNEDVIIVKVVKASKTVQWINQNTNTQLYSMEYDISQDVYPIVCIRKSSIKIFDLF